MDRRSLLFAQLYVAALVAVLHAAGFAYFLYWRFPWFDIITHFLGGVWAGLFAAWVWTIRGRAPTLTVCIAGAFALGIAWEIFETAAGATEFPADALDTAKDLAVDVLGILAAWRLARRMTRP